MFTLDKRTKVHDFTFNYFSRYAEKGIINNRFLCLKNVKRATAENITKEIEKGVQDYGGLPADEMHKKMVGFGADGASVNTGCKQGIGVRLAEKQKLLTSVHCMAHRLELSLKDVILIGHNSKQLHVTKFLENIFKFYHTTEACCICLQKPMVLLVCQLELVEHVGSHISI